MENEIENKSGIIQRIVNAFNEKRKIIISIFIIIIFSLFGFKFFDYYKEMQSIKVSEKYIQAGLYLSTNKKEQSLKIYEEIINSKNKFYSILALNNIIENDLEIDSSKILDFFSSVEQIGIEKEQKNLIKLKKALYLFKISNIEEGNALLNEIITDDSKWKNVASELIR